MLSAVLSGYALGLAAPLLVRMLKGGAGLAAALLPAFLFFFFLQFVPVTVAGEPWRFPADWNPATGSATRIGADTAIDGLSLLCALTICVLAAVAAVRWRDEARAGPVPSVRLSAIFFVMSSALAAVTAESWVLLASAHFALTASGVLLLASEPAARNRAVAMPAAAVWLVADFALLAGLLLLNTAGERAVAPSPGWTAGLIAGAAALKAGIFPVLTIRTRLAGLPASAALGLVFAGLAPASAHLILRFAAPMAVTPVWSTGLMVLGAAGLALSAPQMLVERRPARLALFAGSAVMSLAFGLVGIGSGAAIGAACAALLLHATAIAGLALCAAVLADRYRAADIYRLPGAWLTSPFLTGVWGLAALTAGGLFPSVGLISLDRALAGIAGAPSLGITVAAAAFVLAAFFCLGGGIARVARAMMAGASPLPAAAPLQPVSLGLAFALCFLAGTAGFYPAAAHGLLIGPAVRMVVQDGDAPFLWSRGAALALAAPWSSLMLLTGLYLWREPRVRPVAARLLGSLRLPIFRDLKILARYAGAAGLPSAPLRFALAAAAVIGLGGLLAGAVGLLFGLPWAESVAGARARDPWFVVAGSAAVMTVLVARMPRWGGAALCLGAAGAILGLLIILAGAKSLGFALILSAGLQTGLLSLWTQGLGGAREVPRRPVRRLRDGAIAALAGLLVFGLTTPHAITLAPDLVGLRIKAPATDAVALLFQQFGAGAVLSVAAVALAATLWIVAGAGREAPR